MNTKNKTTMQWEEIGSLEISEKNRCILVAFAHPKYGIEVYKTATLTVRETEYVGDDWYMIPTNRGTWKYLGPIDHMAPLAFVSIVPYKDRPYIHHTES